MNILRMTLLLGSMTFALTAFAGMHVHRQPVGALLATPDVRESTWQVKPQAATWFTVITDFSSWQSETQDGSTVLTSPPLAAPAPFDELIASWNVDRSVALTVEVQAAYPDHGTKWYCLGRWSADGRKSPRESVTKQADADGDVLTDTLSLTKPAGTYRLRLTLLGDKVSEANVRFIGVNGILRSEKASQRDPNKAAWGKSLLVPERCQIDYKGGAVWCSPTSVTMVMNYWAGKLKRDDLRMSVPDVAAAVHDPKWPGTGNWPFNTALPGSLPGMRAYVTRLRDLRDLETWIAAGVPVVISVSYAKLKQKPSSGDDGHIVVCVGLSKDGKFIINDPWAKKERGENVRKVFARERVIAGWASSKNTVYLIYPNNWKIPVDKDAPWEAR
jgi:hypothetical protein